jgi:uracil phosphoribosyltransferase
MEYIMSENFREIKHPIVQHKLSTLRNKDTDAIGFRGIMNELGALLAYEYSRDIEVEEFEFETPMQKTTGFRPKNFPIIVSIMRAGNGLVDGVLQTLPYSPVGHIGIYRDKFIDNTVEYYFKLPQDYKGRDILLLDPMLATGDTAIASIDRLKQYEVGKITMLSVLASPHGVERMNHFHPDVDLICVSKEEGLNDKGYILPGMGDAGDRLYNTK